MSSREASARFGVTHDYVAALCRRGKVRGALIGRMWFVDTNSLQDFFARVECEQQERRRTLSQQFRTAHQTA